MFREVNQWIRNTLLQPHRQPIQLQLIQPQGRQKQVWIGFFTLLTVLVIAQTSGYSQSLTVRVQRWLAVRQISGSVTYFSAETSRAARRGDRLQAVGDGLSTGEDAAAVLEVDTQIGTVEVAETTKLTVQALDISPSDGRITRLRIDQGQARLKIRPFTNIDSRLEIETPAGISGVRGTEFGLNVSPSGKMGVATLEGSVVTEAQG